MELEARLADPRMHWSWASEHDRVFHQDMAIVRELLERVERERCVIADLGCNIGGFTRPMAERARALGGMVHSFDLYETTGHQPGTNFEEYHKGYPTMEFFRQNVGPELMAFVDVRVKCSWEAADFFQNGAVDFIWVDADHRRECVLKELEAWWPKLRDGATMAGHDWMDEGVRDALQDFFGEEDYEIHQSTSMCWSKVKA